MYLKQVLLAYSFFLPSLQRENSVLPAEGTSMAWTETPPGINQLASQTRIDASPRIPGKTTLGSLLHASRWGNRQLWPRVFACPRQISRLFAQEHLQDMESSWSISQTTGECMQAALAIAGILQASSDAGRTVRLRLKSEQIKHPCIFTRCQAVSLPALGPGLPSRWA